MPTLLDPALAPAFRAGLLLSLSLIMALGPQNAHVMRMGLHRQHVLLTVVICIASDALLIGLGVTSLAYLGGISETMRAILVIAGAVFLGFYGAQALARWRHGASLALDGAAQQGRGTVMTRRQATLTALAFAWLNPHAWLDTAVLIGSASMAWGYPGNAVFGIGAVTGSFLWFLLLGVAVLWLGQRLHAAKIWRTLDALVVVMMWGTALMLLLTLRAD